MAEPKTWASMRESVPGLPDNKVILPGLGDGQCPECHFWDISNEGVWKAMADAGRDLNEAACICPNRRNSNEKRMERLIEWANLPHSWTAEGEPRTFDNFKLRQGEGIAEAYHAAVRFSHHEGPRILVLIGNTGTGRSHLLEAIGRVNLDQGRAVRYELTSKLMDRLRATYEDDANEDMSSLMAWYGTFTTILLDDLGLDRSTAFSREKIVEIVEGRIMYGGRIAIATNLIEEDIRNHYGPRLASRLWDRSDEETTLLVTIDATDYRASRRRLNN